MRLINEGYKRAGGRTTVSRLISHSTLPLPVPLRLNPSLLQPDRLPLITHGNSEANI